MYDINTNPINKKYLDIEEYPEGFLEVWKNRPEKAFRSQKAAAYYIYSEIFDREIEHNSDEDDSDFIGVRI